MSNEQKDYLDDCREFEEYLRQRFEAEGGAMSTWSFEDFLLSLLKEYEQDIRN